MFPNIFQTLFGKSSNILSWSHYFTLIRVKDSTARQWYTNETAEQNWSVRTLQRNIDTQYYNRLLSSQNKQPVEKEMKNLTKDYQNDKLVE